MKKIVSIVVVLSYSIVIFSLKASRFSLPVFVLYSLFGEF